MKNKNILTILAFKSYFVVYNGEFINFYLRKINIIRLFVKNGAELSINKKCRVIIWI